MPSEPFIFDSHDWMVAFWHGLSDEFDRWIEDIIHQPLVGAHVFKLTLVGEGQLLVTQVFPSDDIPTETVYEAPTITPVWLRVKELRDF